MKKNRREYRTLFLYLVVFLIAELSIMITGLRYYNNFENNFNANVESQLRLISDLKVHELGHWIGEQRADAEIVFGNNAFAKYVKRYFKNPADSAAKREIKVWMKEFQIGFNYNAVKLIDLQLVKKIIIPEAKELNLAYILTGDIDSLKAGKLVFEDFYYNELINKTFSKVLIPVLDVRRLIGIIELRIDPQTYLYPILASSPISSETSETFILRREGKEAVYLSELKFQKNSALNLKVPLENRNVVAVQAAFGHEGILKGKGYRGTDVIAFVKKVPNSPWYLIAQADESEIYGPLKDKRLETVLLFFSLSLLAGMGIWIFWRNQRSQILKERIKSAETLHASEERFRVLFDKAPLSYQSLDADGNFVDINDTWLETFGYQRDEVIGKWFGDFLSPKEVEAFKERFPILKEIGKLHSEFEMIHKNGTIFYASFEGRIARDADGNFLQTYSILQDVTLLKKSELESQVTFEISQGITTTDNLNDLMKLIHQSLGKILYSENIFVALYNEKTGLFSFPYWVDEFDPTPEPEAMEKSLSSYVFRTGKPVLFSPELFQQLKEQNKIEVVGSLPLSWIGAPLKTPDKTIGVIVLQHYKKENVYSERDIQLLYSVGSQIAMAIERKLVEEVLRNERLLLRTVIDNIPDSIYCKDTATRKTLANLTELLYSGVKSDAEILGKTDFDLHPKEIAEGFYADDQLVLQSGQPLLNREEYVVGATGEKRWLLTSKLPLKDKNGNIIGLVGIGRDITERKRAEEEIKLKNKELARISSEKDKFFSIIAHDLRGPFNGFLGLTQIMAEELDTLSKEELLRMAKGLEKSASTLFNLLENLLQWARMQQGSIPFNPIGVQLLTFVNESIPIVLDRAKIKGINIIVDISADLRVFADHNMLQSIIRNLVSNALKFTHKGGKVTISASSGDDNKVVVAIKDTGIGMSSEMVDNLFRLDVQTGRQGTKGESSSGLGLLLCKEFIEKNGGKIWVESEEGVGSTMYFTLAKNIS